MGVKESVEIRKLQWHPLTALCDTICYLSPANFAIYSNTELTPWPQMAGRLLKKKIDS